MGVKRGASQDAIQAGYRRMALKWHPQRNPNNLEVAMAQFALVAEAYDVLSDAQKKSIYDEYGLKVFEEGMLSFPGYQFVGDPLQQFNKFFASDSSFVPLTQGETLLGMKVREPPRVKEEDLALNLEVTLEELYAGRIASSSTPERVSPTTACRRWKRTRQLSSRSCLAGRTARW